MRYAENEKRMKQLLRAGVATAAAAAVLGLAGCSSSVQMPDTIKIQNAMSADDIAVSFHVALPLCPKKEALRPISVLPPEKREEAAGAPPISVFRHHSRP